MKKINTMEEIFLLKLNELYDVECQLVKVLPTLEKEATDAELKLGLAMHLEETKEHKKRLEEIFDICGVEPQVLESKAIRGIIKDGENMMNIKSPDEVKDFILASSARNVEHYEMAGYLSLITSAHALKMPDVAETLSEIYFEEESADKSLAIGMKNISLDIKKNGVFGT